jgi:hypothetical protein
LILVLPVVIERPSAFISILTCLGNNVVLSAREITFVMELSLLLAPCLRVGAKSIRDNLFVYLLLFHLSNHSFNYVTHNLKAGP